MKRNRPMSWRLATTVAVLLSALVVAAPLLSPSEESGRFKRVDLPEDITRCTTDADCALVEKIGCCACRASGASWAINRTQADALRRFLKRNCRGRAACVQVDTCRNDLAPVCRDGRCAARIVAGTGGGTAAASRSVQAREG